MGKWNSPNLGEIQVFQCLGHSNWTICSRLANFVDQIFHLFHFYLGRLILVTSDRGRQKWENGKLPLFKWLLLTLKYPFQMPLTQVHWISNASKVPSLHEQLSKIKSKICSLLLSGMQCLLCLSSSWCSLVGIHTDNFLIGQDVSKMDFCWCPGCLEIHTDKLHGFSSILRWRIPI